MSAKPLSPLVLNDLGVYGLNTQASPGALPPQWLAKADNIILDEQGRISSRKGIQQVSTTVTGEEVQSIVEYKKANGSTEMFCGTDGDIYKINTANSPYTLDAVTRTGTPQTISSGHWQWVNFNEKLYGVQNGHTPVYYSGTAWTDLVDLGSYNPPSGITTFDPSCVLGEYGRLWVGGMTEKNNVIYYSDTLQGDKWNTGAAGQIDLKTVWGNDEIVAIKAFMGKLIIFGTKNIAIYNNPDDPTTLALDELIEGIGLKARDSVANLGDDILFLSNTGVRSLARTVTSDGKMPLRNFSKNIRDELALNITTADMERCKAAYCLCGGFYMLAFPDRNTIYYMDFTIINPDSTPRVSKFVFDSGQCPTAMLSTVDGTMWMGRNDVGANIAKYQKYFDQIKTDETATYGTQVACEAAGHTWESVNSKCWSTTNQSYTGSFRTVWLDFSQVGSNPSITKILKEFFGVIVGGKDMNVDFTWYRDYNVNGTTQSFTLTPTATGAVFLWNAPTSLYSSATYSPGYNPTEYKIPLSRTGKVLQIEMKAGINGYKASLQSMALLAKEGKIR
jgi:hypothetical protein